MPSLLANVYAHKMCLESAKHKQKHILAYKNKYKSLPHVCGWDKASWIRNRWSETRKGGGHVMSCDLYEWQLGNWEIESINRLLNKEVEYWRYGVNAAARYLTRLNQLKRCTAVACGRSPKVLNVNNSAKHVESRRLIFSFANKIITDPVIVTRSTVVRKM
jgi:hypothetical protein